VPPEIELAGLDIPEMGAPGYPEFITQISQGTNHRLRNRRGEIEVLGFLIVSPGA